MRIPINVQRIIQETEQKNVNLPYEVLTAFSRRTGDAIFSIRGNEAKVSIPRAEVIRLAKRFRKERNVVTHNHVGEFLSLSPEDAALAFELRCAQFRGTDRNRRVYIMDLPDIITSSDVDKSRRLADRFSNEVDRLDLSKPVKSLSESPVLPVLERMRKAFEKKFPGLKFREESLDRVIQL